MNRNVVFLIMKIKIRINKIHLQLGNWSLKNHVLSIPKGCFDLEDENYGNTGYGVSSLGIQN